MSVYFITARCLGLGKIGFAKNPWNRLLKMQVDSPVALSLERAFDGGLDHERELHRQFACDRVRGEWFNISPELGAFMATQPAYVHPMRGYSARDMSNLLGISISYASEILSGVRRPSRPLAINIFMKAGRKFGPVADLTDDDIATLARIEGIAA